MQSEPSPSAPRFVVQLCESSEPFQPDQVPLLQLFDLYHLYCNSEPPDGPAKYSLRLGYFKEPGNAKAIAAYLAPYFRHPLVVQIDTAEIVSSLRARFLPGKDMGASAEHATVVLATPPPLQTRRQAAVTTRSPNKDERSFWSRLLDSLRRLHAAA